MTEITDKKKLPPAVERFILHWGDMGDQWGVNRSVSQIHGLLYLAEAPMTAEDIADTLGMARSNVSNSIKELLAWNLIRRVPILGDRRDHFEAETDIWEVAARIAAGRKEREIDPAIAALRACVSDAADDPAVSAVASQPAEGDAVVHRAGRSLVRADAQRAAQSSGRPGQARREDRQLPAGGKVKIEEFGRSVAMASARSIGIAGPSELLLDDHRFRALLPDDDWGRAADRDLAALLQAPRGRQDRRLCRRGRGILPQPRRLVARAGHAPDRRTAADRRRDARAR